MSDWQLMKEIKNAVIIPVKTKVQIGHCVEVQILEVIGVDYIDKSEVLIPADEDHHINKHNFQVREGAAMNRTKGEAGMGNIVEAIRHVRSVMGEIRSLRNIDDGEVFAFAMWLLAPYDLGSVQPSEHGRRRGSFPV